MNRQDIRSHSLGELTEYLQQREEKPFRARQVFAWVHQKGADDFSRMKNLPAGLRQKLSRDFSLAPLKVLGHPVSRDGTEKLLFELPDKKIIELCRIKFPGEFTHCPVTFFFHQAITPNTFSCFNYDI